MSTQTIVLTVTLIDGRHYRTNAKSDVAAEAKLMGVMIGALRGCLHNLTAELLNLSRSDARNVELIIQGIAEGEVAEKKRGFANGRLGVITRPDRPDGGGQ